MEAVGRTYLCPFIGKELGGVSGRNIIYECDAAAKLRDEGRLKLPQKESARIVKLVDTVPVKKSFWKDLFGL